MYNFYFKCDGGHIIRLQPKQNYLRNVRKVTTEKYKKLDSLFHPNIYTIIFTACGSSSKLDNNLSVSAGDRPDVQLYILLHPLILSRRACVLHLVPFTAYELVTNFPWSTTTALT